MILTFEFIQMLGELKGIEGCNRIGIYFPFYIKEFIYECYIKK